MRILIAADIYPPDIGGPATYAEFLKTQLPAFGMLVELICYSDKAGRDVVRVVRSGSRLVRYVNYFWQLKKRARQADVIYAMGPESAGVPASWVATLLRKPLVVKVVGDYAWEQARNRRVTDIGIDEFQRQKFSGRVGRLQRAERRVCRRAQKVIVPSQYLKRIVSGWGIDERKIEVIYNAVPGWSPHANAIATEQTIVSIGRLVPWKGFELLISLMPDLLMVKPDLKLAIYGSGPDQAKLEELIRQLKAARAVSITKVDHEELMFRLSSAVMLVLNTGYEGFAHTVLEAMAAGTPVVTTNIGGNPEIITDGHNGLLVAYNQAGELKAAILRLLNDSALRQQLVSNAARTWQRFSVEAMLEQTASMLRQYAR